MKVPSHAGVRIAVASPRSAPPGALVATDVRTVTWVVVTGGAVTGGAADGVADVEGADVEGGGVPAVVVVPACVVGFRTVNHPATATRASSATAATSHGA